MTIEPEKLKDYNKLFNDVIKYVVDIVCNYFKIEKFNEIKIICHNMDNYTINGIIKYDYHNDIFKYKNKIYKPKFDNCIYDIFEEVVYRETYNKLDLKTLYIIINDFEEYCNLHYELNGEIWADKMIKDIYKMMN